MFNNATNNMLIMTDAYKETMKRQYKKGTEFVYSYIESRGGRYNETVFFGLQMFVKRYLTQRITVEDIDEAEIFWNAHIPGHQFEREKWQIIIDEFDGFLPVVIKALPEGVVVPTGIVLATIVNTDPRFFWLTTFVETMLLRAIWYPVTVATNSFKIRQLITEYMELTSDDVSGVLYKLHDFGARGTSSHETSEIGGAAHIMVFRGSDTSEGVREAMLCYDANKTPYRINRITKDMLMAATSIVAAEHSTITSWGKEHEVDAYRNMLSLAPRGGLVAVVSDSYDIFTAVKKHWGETLKQEVIDSGAILVVRPDSGDPVETPVRVIQQLDEKFGHTVNKKGYKVLNNVRVIQGDGINYDSILRILKLLTSLGYSTDCVAFGMGGALLQIVNRDDQRFAMKCSATMRDGEWYDVYKSPIGQPDKNSKRGRFQVTHEQYKWENHNDNAYGHNDMLRTVFNTGRLGAIHTIDEVRARIDKAIAA